MYLIRIAVDTDRSHIVAIHNQAITSSNANAYLEPFTVEASRDWFTIHNPDEYPALQLRTSWGGS